MAANDKGSQSVESVDVMSQAINDAMERIKLVTPSLGGTLVDSISVEEWKAWDARDEKALVADKDGLNDGDIVDDEQKAA